MCSLNVQECDFPILLKRRQANGTLSSEWLLTSSPVWGNVLAFAQEEVKHGVSREDMLAVAGRSAEFDAVNQMLNKGSNLKQIVLTTTLLMWPEDGPDTEA